MIYICIPSHNEERTVGILLWKIRQVLTAFPRDYELLVLDDASTDATREVLAPYARILPLTVLRHAERRGYAASLDELLREAVRRSEYPRRDVILTLQADFTEDPDDIPTLLKRVESGADIVTTRTTIAREHASRTLRWIRGVTGRLLRRLDWPDAVTDVLSGMRAYRVIGVKKALEEHGERRLAEWAEPWAANAALLRAVRPHVRRVDEIEVTLRPDRRQRDSRFDPWANARALARMAFRRAPIHTVPVRRAPAAVVTAAELAAAARPAPAAPAAEPGRRGPRGGRERQPARAEAPRKKVASAAEPGRGERGERSDVAERPEKAARGEKQRATRRERADGAREPTRRGRAERPPSGAASEPLSELPESPPVAETSGRTGRRGRRGRGGAAAGASATEEPRPLDALAADGALAEVLGPDLIESLGALSSDSAASGGTAERKSRRRRSSRRTRGRKGAQEGATDPLAASDAEAADGPPDPGNGMPAPAGSADMAPSAEDAGGGDTASEPMPEGAEGAAAARPRRRARRGGRGRSRGRRGGGGGGGGGGGDDAGAAGESGDAGEAGGTMAGTEASSAGSSHAGDAAPAPERDFTPATPRREPFALQPYEAPRPFVPEPSPPRPESPAVPAPGLEHHPAPPAAEPREAPAPPPAERNTTGPAEG